MEDASLVDAKWTITKEGMMVWIGFMWFMTGTGGGLLWSRWWTIGFCKQLETCLLAAQMLVCQLCRMKFVMQPLLLTHDAKHVELAKCRVLLYRLRSHVTHKGRCLVIGGGSCEHIHMARIAWHLSGPVSCRIRCFIHVLTESNYVLFHEKTGYRSFGHDTKIRRV
jgi:hypothetical protein